MSAYFLASNGLLYRNPLISGANWLIVFDADDEPELLLAKGNLDAGAARLAAVSILEQSGMAATVSGPPRQMLRPFDESADARDSWCFWLDVCEPIPAELLPVGAGVVEPPEGAFVESFGQLWGAPI